jgi:hypothetical protein
MKIRLAAQVLGNEQHMKPFTNGVDGGRKASRTSANDNQIIHFAPHYLLRKVPSSFKN